MKRFGAIIGCTFLLVACAAVPAQAAPVTIGSPLTASFLSASPCGPSACTLGNFALAASPITGTIVRWHLKGASGGSFKLRVLLQSEGGSTYKGGAVSSPQTPASAQLQTFATSLPIHAGESIALEVEANAKVGSAEPPGAFGGAWIPPLEEGEIRTPLGPSDDEYAFNAEVERPPTLDTFSPTSGPAAGGTEVTITGAEFENANAVKFGSTPSPSFTVDSEGQITATAPPSASSGPVRVSVSTPAGKATSVQQFTYIGAPATAGPPPATCTVPRLVGKKLKTVRKSLVKADCKLRQVKGHKGRLSKVKSQKPKPGTVLPEGAGVNVKVG